MFAYNSALRERWRLEMCFFYSFRGANGYILREKEERETQLYTQSFRRIISTSNTNR